MFVVADVCACLGIVNITNALKRIDPDDFHSMKVTDERGREPSMYVVNESGLFALVLNSRKAEALEFKRWVPKEVLPAIRTTGQYGIEEQTRNLAGSYTREVCLGIDRKRLLRGCYTG